VKTENGGRVRGQTRDRYDGSRGPESQALHYASGNTQTRKRPWSPAEDQCIELGQIQVCLREALIDHGKHPLRVYPGRRIAPAAQSITFSQRDRAHVSSGFYCQ
jgi:hypothetical protein